MSFYVRNIYTYATQRSLAASMPSKDIYLRFLFVRLSTFRGICICLVHFVTLYLSCLFMCDLKLVSALCPPATPLKCLISVCHASNEIVYVYLPFDMRLTMRISHLPLRLIHYTSFDTLAVSETLTMTTFTFLYLMAIHLVQSCYWSREDIFKV